MPELRDKKNRSLTLAASACAAVGRIGSKPGLACRAMPSCIA
jgi:hypothetical protein